MNRRQRHPATNGVPVVLPLVAVSPAGDGGSFAVTLDGEPIPDSPVPRNELGRALASTARRAGAPVRVEVHQPDGHVYADIIHPPPQEPDRGTRPRSGQNGFAVHYRGFLPGERVLIAAVERTETANSNGVLTLSITRELAGSPELVLFGPVSGTTFLTRPQ